MKSQVCVAIILYLCEIHQIVLISWHFIVFFAAAGKSLFELSSLLQTFKPYTMKPGKALFLIIGSFIWMVYDLSGIIFRHVEYGKYEKWPQLILSVVFLSIPLVFIALGFTYLKRAEALRKKVAVAGTVIHLLWLGAMLYFSISGFETRFYSSEPLKYILVQTFYIHVILLLIFWIMLSLGKTRNAAGWLLAAGLTLAFNIGFQQIFENLGSRYKLQGGVLLTIHEIMGYLSVIFPVSLAAFAIWLLKSETGASTIFKQESPQLAPAEEMLDLDLPAKKVETRVPVESHPVPRVIDWLSDFLMLLIPVFGFVFLLWRGLNKKDRYRRNWALASLLWSTLGLGVYLFLYYPVLEYVDRDGLIFLIAASVIVALLIFWGLALGKVRNDDFDDHVSEDTVPSPLTWTGWTLVAGLPLVGLIMLIVWLVDDENAARRNWAAAKLIYLGVVLMFYLYFYKSFVLNIGELSRLIYRF